MREGNPKRERPRERVRPTRQRHLTARCIGLRDINVNQSPKAEEMWDYADYKAEYMSVWLTSKASRRKSGFMGVQILPHSTPLNMWVQSGGRTHWRVNRGVRLPTTRTNISEMFTSFLIRLRLRKVGVFSVLRAARARPTRAAFLSIGRLHKF